MKLFLTSLEITKELSNEFEKFTKKNINGLKVAFITDAMYAPYGVGRKLGEEYTNEDIRIYNDLYNWEIELIELSKGYPDDFSKFDVIYFNGGFPGYLAKTIRETGFEQILRERIDNDTIIVGSSAGSMIFGNSLRVQSYYPDEEIEEDGAIAAFNYLPFQIFPHYIEENHKELIERNKIEGEDIITLEDTEAISFDGENFLIFKK